MDTRVQKLIAEFSKGAKEGSFRGTLSTGAVDRDGDFIVQKGWNLKHYKKNPVVLFQHMAKVVGSADHVEVNEKSGNLEGAWHFNQKIPLGRELTELYAERDMRALSVGFMGTKLHSLDTGIQDECEDCLGVRNPKTGFFGGRHFQKQELWEFSAVAIGSNPQALAKAASLLAPEEGGRELLDAYDSLQKVLRSTEKEEDVSGLAERVKDLETRLAALADVVDGAYSERDPEEEEEIRSKQENDTRFTEALLLSASLAQRRLRLDEE